MAQIKDEIQYKAMMARIISSRLDIDPAIVLAL